MLTLCHNMSCFIYPNRPLDAYSSINVCRQKGNSSIVVSFLFPFQILETLFSPVSVPSQTFKGSQSALLKRV